MYDSKPVSWDDLPFSQLFLLIKNSYVNEESNELPAEIFSDAPYHRFTATMQIIDLSNTQKKGSVVCHQEIFSTTALKC